MFEEIGSATARGTGWTGAEEKRKIMGFGEALAAVRWQRGGRAAPAGGATA